ncbi:ribulose-phosphate 3-epimerase [Thorsellia kenyensis]|uniref:Ribulose-phosphate 3-epimerase n=1 Tax=Thorsellia kenyensis TaxID=1549888 RepID=A0ABV6CHP0_9GAMM
MHLPIIAPSILAANFAKLGEETRTVLDAGAEWIHFDVMDNHYVPNLSFGPMICEALRKDGITAPIDVHLMVSPVENMIQDFAKAGASLITIHPEATIHLDRNLQMIKDLGCQAGIALNPATSIDCLDYIMDKLDLILVMSVNPGFGGQKFLPSALKKITDIRRKINENNLNIRLSVDGGVTEYNIQSIFKAGADTFVAGSAIFGKPDYATIIKTMKDACR